MPVFPLVFSKAVTIDRKLNTSLVLEIEGISKAFASRALTAASWYGTTRLTDPNDVPLEIVNCFRTDGAGNLDGPNLSSSGIDFLGGRSDLGTLEIALVDMDESLVELTGLRRSINCFLLKNVGAGEGTFYVYGPDMTSLADYVHSYLYIGRETVYVDSYTYNAATATTEAYVSLTVGRGYFQSRQEKHWGKLTADGSGRSGDGDQISPFPRHLIDRRVWLRLGYNATNDGDCISAFVGTIRSFAWVDFGRTLKLSCEDFQAQLKRPLFTDLSKRWVKGGGLPTYRTTLENLPPGANLPSMGNSSPDGDYPDFPVGGRFCALFTSGEWSKVFVMERQVFADPYPRQRDYVIVDNDSLVANPAVGTDVNGIPFNAPFSVRPLIVVGTGIRKPGASDLAGDLIWPETSPDANVPTDHVLAILLMVLTGTGAGTNGDWDIIPQKDWGLGIDNGLIDVSGIVALAKVYSKHRVRVPVAEPVKDAREWLISLLKPFGYVLTVASNGTLSVASIRAPGAAVTDAAPTLTFDDVAMSAGIPAKYEGPSADGADRVTSIRWSDSPFWEKDGLQLIPPVSVSLSLEADALATAGDMEPLEIQCFGAYSRDESQDSPALDGQGRSKLGYPFFKSIPDTPDGISIASGLLRDMQLRFGGTPSIYGVDVTIRQSKLSVGDWVRVTLPQLPNPFNGQRGISGKIAQVVRRTVNLARGTISLELSITSAGNEDVRVLAPALEADGSPAWDGTGKVLTVLQHAFTDSGGSYNDTDAFDNGGVGVGYDVRVYSPDHLYCSQKVRITGKSPTSVTLSAAPALVRQSDGGGSRTPQAGDLVELADWGEQTCTKAKDRFAYFTDADGYLMDGAGGTVSTKIKYS